MCYYNEKQFGKLAQLLLLITLAPCESIEWDKKTSSQLLDVVDTLCRPIFHTSTIVRPPIVFSWNGQQIKYLVGHGVVRFEPIWAIARLNRSFIIPHSIHNSKTNLKIYTDKHISWVREWERGMKGEGNCHCCFRKGKEKPKMVDLPEMSWRKYFRYLKNIFN